MGGHVIEVSPQDKSNIRELVASYLRAVERFRAEDLAGSSPGPHQLSTDSRGRAALAESLNWADAIDSYLRSAHGSKGDWTDGLSEPDRDLVVGFNRVRNIVHHRWWEAVAVQIRMVSGTQVNEWRWGRLPSTSRKASKWETLGDTAFAARLRGRRVIETLDELASIFWPRRGWEIHIDDLEQPGYSVATSLSLDLRRSSES